MRKWNFINCINYLKGYFNFWEIRDKENVMLVSNKVKFIEYSESILLPSYIGVGLTVGETNLYVRGREYIPGVPSNNP